MIPTDEQAYAINSVLAGQHVILTALPGSGKSAVAFELIRRCLDTNIIIVSYNRSLNTETKRHLATMGLPKEKNVRSFTFHGLASALSGTLCTDDFQLSAVLNSLEQGTHYEHVLAGFSLLIVDESQDVRPDLARFIRILLGKVCRDKPALRILLLGDPRQLLYHFYRQNRADARFLTNGDQLYRPINTRAWVQCQLTRSFRSTFAITTVLNALLPGHHMVPRDETSCAPVELYIGDIRVDSGPNIVSILGDERDVLMLCPSTNAASPARAVVRTMISAGIVVNVIRSGNLSDPVQEHTAAPHCVSVQTFCSSKGLEAPVVVVLCDRTSLFDSMENATYVAITRATRRLIIIMDARYTSLEAVDLLTQGVGSCLTVSFLSKVRMHRTCAQMRTWIEDQRERQSVETHKLVVLVGLLSPGQISSYRQHMTSRLVYGGEVEHVFEDQQPMYRCFHDCCDSMVLPNSDTLCFPTLVNIDDTYARSFDSHLLQLVGRISRHLIYLHFTGSVDPSLLAFVQENPSQSASVVALVQTGATELFHCGPYSGNMYELVRFIPALSLLSVAHDAHVGYEDRLSSITSYSFAQRSDVVRRVLGIIHTLGLVLERRQAIEIGASTSWKLAITDRVIRLQDDGLFFRHGAIGVCVVHKATIDTKDHIAAGMRLILYGATTMYIANTMDGSVQEVTTTLPIDHVSALCNAILHVDQDLTDRAFVARHSIY